MEVLSSVFSLGVTIRGYNEDVLKELLREQHPETIYITELTEKEFKRSNELSKSYQALTDGLGSKLVPVGVDTTGLEKYREEYIREKLSTPELSIKRNMLELIDDTIYNYLAQYWKGPETVNSEVTDSLFRAKHKLFSSVFYELETETWEKQNGKILDAIKKTSPTDKSVILSPVESRYWFKDHLDELLS